MESFLALKEDSLYKGISDILGIKESELDAVVMKELNKF